MVNFKPIAELPEYIPSEAASVYAKISREYGQEYYSEVADEVVSNMESGRLLDVGAGAGYLPIEIVKISRDIYVDMIDYTFDLVKIGREAAKKEGVGDRINFIVGDIYSIPMRREIYDMILCMGVLHSLRYPLKAFEELNRVLKTGFEAWIFDPTLLVGNGRSIEELLNEEEMRIYKHYLYYHSGEVPSTYSEQEARELILKTPFDYFDMTKEEYLRIKLRKISR